jgi:hypothetical protein
MTSNSSPMEGLDINKGGTQLVVAVNEGIAVESELKDPKKRGGTGLELVGDGGERTLFDEVVDGKKEEEVEEQGEEVSSSCATPVPVP